MNLFSKNYPHVCRIISISAKVHANDERKDSRGDEGEKELERGAGGKRAKRGRKKEREIERKKKSRMEERRIAGGLGETGRGGKKRGRTTVCLGVARSVTERIVSLDTPRAT